MATKNSASSVLIALLILITFPIWIGLIAGAFGIVAGVFGAVFGVIGGVLGAIAGVIGAILHAILHPFWSWGPHFHFFGFHTVGVIIVILMVVLLARRNNSGRQHRDDK